MKIEAYGLRQKRSMFKSLEIEQFAKEQIREEFPTIIDKIGNSKLNYKPPSRKYEWRSLTDNAKHTKKQ